MPYKLEQSSPRLWFVVNIETGKKHEGKPISLKKAKAQLRILKQKVEGGAMEGIQVVDLNSLADFRNANDEMEDLIGEVEMVSGEEFDMEQINQSVRHRFRRFNNNGEIPNGMVVVVLKFQSRYTICFLTRQQYNTALQRIPNLNRGGKLGGDLSNLPKRDAIFEQRTDIGNQLKALTDKSNPTPDDLTKIKDLSTQLRGLNVSQVQEDKDHPYQSAIYSTVPFGYNPPLGGNHNYQGNQSYNVPYIEWIHKHPWMVPFGVWGEQRMAHFGGKQPGLGPQEQQDWLKGYDFIQGQFNYWTHEVWRSSLDPDRYGTDDAEACGKFWGCCYNRSWQYVHDWTSTSEQIWDVAKNALQTGAEVALAVV